jgi:hypothetical protein
VDQDWRLESEALLASDPFFAAPRSRILGLRDEIAARRPYPVLALPVWPHDSALGPVMQTYLVGLLDARLGDALAAARSAAALDAMRDAPFATTARSLAHGLRAEIARTRGDLRGALAELDGFEFGTPTRERSIAHWGARERFLRAELLHALKRDTEALPWYESFPAGYDGPYVAAAHLRHAEIDARLGNRERARFHFRRFIAFWSACDAELRPKVDSARAALAADPLQ